MNSNCANYYNKNKETWQRQLALTDIDIDVDVYIDIDIDIWFNSDLRGRSILCVKIRRHRNLISARQCISLQHSRTATH